MRLNAFAAAALAAAALAGVGRADAPARPAPHDLYMNTVRACAWVATPYGRATGWVADVRRRLLVTNFHAVVGPRNAVQGRVALMFPVFDADGQLVTQRSVYQKYSKELTRVGTVLFADPRRDLAVVEVDELPPGTRALPPAARPVGPSDTVHLVGNRGRSALLWAYVRGTVRQVGRQRMSYVGGQVVDCVCLETQLPSNPGDSGGPVVNDAGELVGVNAAGDPADSTVNLSIDVSEVRAFLAEAFAGAPPPDDLPPAPGSAAAPQSADPDQGPAPQGEAPPTAAAPRPPAGKGGWGWGAVGTAMAGAVAAAVAGRRLRRRVRPAVGVGGN